MNEEAELRFHTARMHLDDAIRSLQAVREHIRPDSLIKPESPHADDPAHKIEWVMDAADGLAAEFVGDPDAEDYPRGYFSLCSCGGGHC